jgi:transcriptional regulator with XRE-family HTH domain
LQRHLPAYARKIRALRRKLELEQWQLALKLGVARNTVSRWELGLLEPRKKKYQKLIAFLYEVDEVLGWPKQFIDFFRRQCGEREMKRVIEREQRALSAAQKQLTKLSKVRSRLGIEP